MKYLLYTIALVVTVYAAQSAPKSTAKSFYAEVVRVQSNGLLVDILEVQMTSSGSGSIGNGGGVSVRTKMTRSGKLAFLVPGTKCAIGDRFEVTANEVGTQTVRIESGEDQPVRKYSVVRARRL
jgi:hypothetical protein